MTAARYDGFADWYDGWAVAGGGPFLAAAGAALAELAPPGPGLAVDVGCGTGRHAEVARGCGYQVVGVDVSADQLRLARPRLPVARADGRALPFGDGSVRLAFSLLTHTDLDGFDRLVTEALRVAGTFVYVGVHPCFVGPSAAVGAAGATVGPGYLDGRWLPPGSASGVVRRRVGVHHLPLADLLTALTPGGARLDRIVERGPHPIPEILAVRVLPPARQP